MCLDHVVQQHQRREQQLLWWLQTPSKEENVKSEVTTQKKVAEVGVIQTPKTEEKEAVNVKQEEPVKVNVGN